MPGTDDIPLPEPADDPTSFKTAAKFNDTVTKAITSAPLLAGWGLVNKGFVVLSKMGSIVAGVPCAVKELDNGAISPFAWSCVGVLNNSASAAISTVLGSELAMKKVMEYQVRQSLSGVLADHLATHTGLRATLTGVWNGSPFLSPPEATELKRLFKEKDMQTKIQRFVTSVYDGKPALKEFYFGVKETASKATEKAWVFKSPELPKLAPEGMISPGLVKEAERMRPMAKTAGMLAKNVVPVFSAAAEIYAFSKKSSTWRELFKEKGEDARPDVIAAFAGSSLSMIGAIVYAAASHTRTAAKMPPRLMPVSLGFMVGGAAVNFFAERMKGSSKSVGDSPLK